MIDPTLAYWLGFGTCLAMVAFVCVLSAVRMSGLCSQEERDEPVRVWTYENPDERVH